MYKISEDVVLRPDDGKILVLETGNVIEVNDSGVFILKCLETPNSINDLISSVEDNYQTSDINPGEIKEIVTEFVNFCEENKIIVTV